MGEIGLQTTVCRTRDIPFSRLDDELLAIDSQAGYVYSLNPTAGRAFALLATPVSVQALCARLCREYTVDEATCEREVLALLRSLSEAGLVDAQ